MAAPMSFRTYSHEGPHHDGILVRYDEPPMMTGGKKDEEMLQSQRRQRRNSHVTFKFVPVGNSLVGEDELEEDMATHVAVPHYGHHPLSHPQFHPHPHPHLQHQHPDHVTLIESVDTWSPSPPPIVKRRFLRKAFSPHIIDDFHCKDVFISYVDM